LSAQADGGYDVMPHPPSATPNNLTKATGADKAVSFWQLPTWVIIFYITAAIIAIIGLFKLLPIIIGKIENLYTNRHRKDIFLYVENNPGCTVREVSKNRKINLGTVKYHIWKLEADRKIVTKKIGKFLRIYRPSDRDDIEIVMLSHIKNKARLPFLAMIMDNPGITNQEIAVRLNLRKSTVSWHANALLRDMIIRSERDGKFIRYYMNVEAEGILSRFIR
jgi:predicted transcriptional regulator